MISERKFKNLYKLEKEIEVVVIQMGKVGSTSLVESINRNSIKTTQSHFITIDSIKHLMDISTDPNLNYISTFHNIVQSFANTILLSKINRYKASDTDKKDKRLKIISIVRDPLTWYFSNLSQNFHEYEDAIYKYSDKNVLVDDQEELKHIIFVFVKDLLELYNKEVAIVDDRRGKLYQELAKKYNNDDKKMILINQFWTLFRPHVWFERHLDPILDNSVYDLKFDSKKGYLITHGSYYDLLIFRFEDIKENCSEAIESFLGINDFNLRRLNISKGKKIGKIVNEIRDQIFSEIPFNKLYPDSKYMNTFYSEKLK